MSFLPCLNISVRVKPKEVVKYPSLIFGGSSLNHVLIERDEKSIDKVELPEEGKMN